MACLKVLSQYWPGEVMESCCNLSVIFNILFMAHVCCRVFWDLCCVIKIKTSKHPKDDLLSPSSVSPIGMVHHMFLYSRDGICFCVTWFC